MADNGGTSIDMREVQEAFRRLARQSPALADRAAQLAAEAFQSEAEIIAPVISGDLKGSGFVERIGIGRWRFGFGIRYAAAAHERSTQSPQYLLRAIKDNARTFIPGAFRRAFEDQGR